MRLHLLPLILLAASSNAFAAAPPQQQPTADELRVVQRQLDALQAARRADLAAQAAQMEAQQPAAPLAPLKFPANDGYQSDIQFAGPLDPLINALHSPDFAAREEATRTLLRLNMNRLPDVRAALAKETDLEAASRLTDVAAHLFLKARTPMDGPGSLLGVKLVATFELLQLDPKDDRLHATVVIEEVQPGFPAAQLLHAGDRLIGIDGKEFPADFDIDDFRALIGAHHAGSVVPMTVVRDGKSLALNVQVAGLPQQGTAGLEDAIGQRNQALALFLADLPVGVKSPPLVLQDQTQEPIDLNGGNKGGVIIINGNAVQLHGNVQIQGIQGGVIILNGGGQIGGGQIIPLPPPAPALNK